MHASKRLCGRQCRLCDAPYLDRKGTLRNGAGSGSHAALGGAQALEHAALHLVTLTQLGCKEWLPAQNTSMWTAHSSDADVMDAVLARALQLLPTLSLQTIAEINRCVGRNYYNLPRAGRTMLDAINKHVLQQVGAPPTCAAGTLARSADMPARLHGASCYVCSGELQAPCT